MQLPIVAPAPIVTAHADIFRDLFENRRQFRHFQNYLTGLIVLDNKSLANITRCVLESADKPNITLFSKRRVPRPGQDRPSSIAPQTKTCAFDGWGLLSSMKRVYMWGVSLTMWTQFNMATTLSPRAHSGQRHYCSGPVRFLDLPFVSAR